MSKVITLYQEHVTDLRNQLMGIKDNKYDSVVCDVRQPLLVRELDQVRIFE